MTNKTVNRMDHCPVDGTLFEVQPANQKYCSTECKRKADSVARRARKYAARLKEYNRLGKLLGYEEWRREQNDEAAMLRRQLVSADKNSTKQATVILVCLVVIVGLVVALVVK